MAELNVQPKKKRSILPWILLLLGIAALIWYLMRRNNDTQTASTPTTVTTDTGQNNIGAATAADWNGIDINAPAVRYEEITNPEITVRGHAGYSIYGIGENILFDENQATIRPDAAANLQQILGSVDKRYKGGAVRVYGYTDAQGSAGYNKELAQQRAEAVRTWLQNNGIDAGRISVNAIGEGRPVASNSTEEGRQQNRRVEIVARGGSSSVQ